MALPKPKADGSVLTLPPSRPATGPLLALSAGVAVLFCSSLALGSVRIPIHEVVTILFGGKAHTSAWQQIVTQIRLPRAITAGLGGAALAVSGLQMQTLFRNPLAGPFVLGISAGASLGVALVVLSFGAGASALIAGLSITGGVGLTLAASLGAGAVLGLVLLVARRVEDNMTLLILGLMFGYASGALVSVLIYFSASNAIQAYLIWTFGSFSGVTFSQLVVFAPTVLVGLLIAGCSIKSLNVLLLGERYAESLGLSLGYARAGILSSATLLAGVTTAFCGPVAFVGIAVPHLARTLLTTSDHRILLPGTCLMGAALTLFADLVARLPGSQVTLPLNAVTALIGAPIVVWIVLRRRTLRASFAS
jgi:iron complex transport system permease protein